MDPTCSRETADRFMYWIKEILKVIEHGTENNDDEDAAGKEQTDKKQNKGNTKGKSNYVS